MWRKCTVRSYAPYDLPTGESSTPPSTFNLIREYRPFKTRCYSHKTILEIGSNLHQQFSEEFEADKRKCILEAESAMRCQGARETEDAVQHALDCAQAQQDMTLSEAEKDQEKAIRDAVLKAEDKMQHEMDIELKKMHKIAELQLAVDIQHIMQKCVENKIKIVAAVKQHQKKLAHEEQECLKREYNQQFKKALDLADKKHRKRMLQLKKEKEQDICIAVAMAQKEEQEKVNRLLREAETKHQAELDVVKQALIEIETHPDEAKQQLEAMTTCKDDLEAELEETRQAFQKYINLTFPSLAPGQADFILPLRKKDLKLLQDSNGQSC